MADNKKSTPSTGRKQRRKKARRRALRRLLVMLVICALVGVVWVNWDKLAPDRLLTTIQDSFSGGAGSYPVDIAGSEAQRLASCQKYTVLLSDSYLTFYNQQGGEAARYTSPTSNALMRQAGKYVLLAEQEGRQVQLFTRSGSVVEIQTEHTILSAAVNANGQCAVLTDGPQGYAVQVTVYDRKGKVLYSRSRNQIATEVALAANGEQVALISLEAAEGSLNSTIHVFSLNSSAQEAKCTYTTDDVLLYRLEYLADDWLAAIGENGTVMLDTADGLATVFTLGDRRLLGYAAADNTLALVTRAYGETGNGQVQVVDKTGSPLASVDFTGDFRHLSANQNSYLLLTDSACTAITTGGKTRTAATAADGQQAVLSSNGQAVVMGLNLLQAYTLQ